MKAGTLLFFALAATATAQLAVKVRTLHPMTGDLAPLRDAVVLCGADGKIWQVGPSAEVAVPDGWRVIEAEVALPGLIDARTTVGLSGLLNWDRRDQEQLEFSTPVQPELRAPDGYNGRDPLVRWVRELGVTTIHTGHAPGALVSGQTMILKTDRASVVGPQDMLSPVAGISVTLGSDGFGQEKKSPGTRAKSVALLRAELVKAREYQRKTVAAEGDAAKLPDRDLHLEALVSALRQEVPLLVTADRHHDIAAALRLRDEFGFRLILDSVAEGYLLLDVLKAAKVPVIVHPTMARASGEQENLKFTQAAELHAAGIPFAFQSGHEQYVPKTRYVLFEAGMAAAHGLPPAQALAACTLRPAEIFGLETRIGSLAPGKDADLALFDGDPLETTTHCIGTIIGGRVVSEIRR
jgi:imidazolonepropionase-like amidohydrolase